MGPAALPIYFCDHIRGYANASPVRDVLVYLRFDRLEGNFEQLRQLLRYAVAVVINESFGAETLGRVHTGGQQRARSERSIKHGRSSHLALGLHDGLHAVRQFAVIAV